MSRTGGLDALLDLPDSLISIGANAFQGCAALTAITLPDRLETVGAYAFADSGLTAATPSMLILSKGDADGTYLVLSFADGTVKTTVPEETAED